MRQSVVVMPVHLEQNQCYYCPQQAKAVLPGAFSVMLKIGIGSKTSTGGGPFKSLEKPEALRLSLEDRVGCKRNGS